ncbi:MAG: hypothetical protein E6I56_04895 [Chloroflexi bacterium]|nr:MAG: hypothetical protein E6I56_04895 [Chloroflexota bacterium]
MWPFGRKREPSAPGVPQPVPAPVVRRDWAGLPPIQRSIAEHPLTAPSDRFSGDLATHHDPSLSGERMGHQVSAEAPAGIVLTVSRPATNRNDGPAMISRLRVQRRHEDAIQATGEWNGDEAAPADEAARPTPSAPAVQRIALVERPVVAPMPDMPLLTALPAQAEPEPVIQRARRPPVAPRLEMPAVQRTEVQEMSAAPRLTLGQARRLGLGSPINRVASHPPVQLSSDQPLSMPLAPTPAAGSQQTTSETAPVNQPPLGNRTEGPEASDPPVLEPHLTVSRLGQAPSSTPPASPRLDLPLAASRSSVDRPDEGPDQTAAATAGVSGAAPAMQPSSQSRREPSVQRTIEMGAGQSSMVHAVPSDPPEAVEARMNSGTGRPLPLATAAVSRTGFLATAQAALAAATPGPTALPAATPAPAAPLVGDRPLRPTALQRSPGSGESPATHKPADRGPQPSRRDASASGSAGVLADRATALEAMAPAITIQRSRPTATAAPTVTAASSSRPALVLTPRWSGAFTGEARSAGRAGDALDEAADERSLPLAPPAVIVQRLAEDASSESPSWPEPAPAAVQREPMDESASTVSRFAMPGLSEVSSGVSAIGSGLSSLRHASQKSEDMDELANKLYDRIRTRLKNELLVDRERAGFLTDLR